MGTNKAQGPKYFKEGANQLNARTIPTGDFNTELLSIEDFTGPFIFEVFRDSTDGQVSVTLQVSMDETEWFDYDERTDDQNLPFTVKDNNNLWSFIRLAFEISANPTGTLTARVTRILTPTGF